MSRDMQIVIVGTFECKPLRDALHVHEEAAWDEASTGLLTYFDDSPVFDKERRLAYAWAEGGLEAEKEMRETIKKEEAAKRESYRREFDEMIERAKAEAAAKEEKKCRLEAQAQSKCEEYEMQNMEDEMEDVVASGERKDKSFEDLSQKKIWQIKALRTYVRTFGILLQDKECLIVVVTLFFEFLSWNIKAFYMPIPVKSTVYFLFRL